MGEFDDKARTWDEDPLKKARARTVALAIRERVPLTGETRVMEYGCGTGLLGFELRPWVGPITLADSSSGMLEVLREKIAALDARDMTPLLLDLAVDPLPEGRHGLIATLMTLHHVADVDRLLLDFHRLLEPGGHLAVADLDLEDGSFHEDGFTGHPGFDRTLLASRAERAGFAEVAFSTVFQVTRSRNGLEQAYPAFLMTARKPLP